MGPDLVDRSRALSQSRSATQSQVEEPGSPLKVRDLIAIMLGVSGIFALLALSTPYDSNSASVCYPWLMFDPPCNLFWDFQSYVGIAEGFGAAAILSFVLVSQWSFSIWFNKPLSLGFSKRLSMTLALVGALTFALFVVMSATYDLWQVSRSFSQMFMFQTIQTQGSSIGVVAFGVWCLTVFCLALRKGFIGALRTFGFPAIAFLGITLLCVYTDQMVNHITNFTSWRLGGIYVLSNWTVFIASISIETVLLLKPKE